MAYEELNAVATKIAPTVFQHTLDAAERAVLLRDDISSQYALQLYPAGIAVNWEPYVVLCAGQFEAMKAYARVKPRSTAAKVIKNARALRVERTYGGKVVGESIFNDMLYFAAMKHKADISVVINEELGRAWTALKLEVDRNLPTYYPSADTWLPLDFWEFFQQVIAPVVIFSHYKLSINELIEESPFTGKEVEKTLLARCSIIKMFLNLKVSNEG